MTTIYTNEGMTEDADWIEKELWRLRDETDTSVFVLSLVRHLANEVVALRRDVAAMQVESEASAAAEWHRQRLYHERRADA